MGRGSGGGLLLEQDLLAGEPFELGDELALAADGGDLVVPVGDEVGEVGVGVGQQVPGDDQDGVADRDQGALFAAAAGEPVVRDPRKVLVREAPMPASPRVLASQGLPLPVVPGLLLPADCRALGAYLAHDTRWPAVGNRVMSTPISAISS